jgi:Lrp/AsnC family transcriptional regulator, leucine-responsive regulatory protein
MTQQDPGYAQSNRPLDPTDRKIIASLQEDAKRTLAVVGRAVGLSPAAVKRRIDRLEDRGVIRGYGARIDAQQLGDHAEALVEIYCGASTAPADIAASLGGFDEILSAFTVSGEPDAVIRVRVENIKALEKVVERLRRNPNIVRTRTLVVLSTIIDRSS